MLTRVAVHGAASISAIGTRFGAVVRRATQRRHRSETTAAYRSAAARVLILGAGFGGVRTALELDRCLGRADDVSVLLVDRGNAQLFTPLLWTVADGRANPTNVVVPIRAFQRGRSFHVLHAEVEQIDLAARTVHTPGGPYPYDILVIALGSVTAVPDVPGLRAHAHVFHTPADALELRNHVIDAVERAHARNGAVNVDDHLRVPGRPEVYVVGDAAWAQDAMTKAPVPPTAQAAEHMGRYVAHAIVAECTGRQAAPYRFSSRGHFTLLGHHTAVAQVGPLTLTGLPAWLLWHGYYLSHIPSWRNRVRLAVDWSLAALTGRDTAQLRLGMETPAAAPRGGTPGLRS